MPRIKKSYSTEFIRCYKTGLLNKEEIKSIPRSTRFYWRKRNLNIDITPHCFEDKNCNELQLKYEKLLQFTKVLLQVIYCYKSMIVDVLASKDIICKCVVLIKEKVSLKRCLHWLNVSFQQYYAWLNRYDCKASLLKLCRKRYNHQLTENEVNVIKKYLYNEEFIHWSLSSI